MEIRELNEFEKYEDGEMHPVKNKYIVHKVIPNLDTLFKLSYNYNVSKREI
jgi:hypothetical protein